MAKTLDYDFTDPQFDGTTGIEAQTGPDLTVTRASDATVMDYFNVLKTVNDNEPRFTGGRRVENLLKQSNGFDTTWTTTRSSVTSGLSDPDGGTSAWSLDEDGTAASTHFLRQSFTTIAGRTYTFSVKAKASNRTWLNMDLSAAGFTGTPSAYFNLGSGALGTADAEVENHKIEDLGSGWYRCSITATADASASTYFRFDVGEADSDITFDGLSQESILVYQAQLEDVSGQDDPAPSAYIATTTAAKAQWYATKRRTSYTEYSEAVGSWSTLNEVTVSSDDVANPLDATTTADKIIPSTNSAAHLAVNNLYSPFTSPPLDTPVVASVYVKAAGYNGVTFNMGGSRIYMNVDLTDGSINSSGGSSVTTSRTFSVEDVGSGWYRLIMGWTWALSQGNYLRVCPNETAGHTGTASETFAGDGTSGIYAYGAQFERGSTATAYIATTDTVASSSFDTAITPTGLLIEEARTNICTYSEDLSNWNAPVDATIDADAATAPDGTTTADRLNVTAGTGLEPRVNNSITTTDTDWCGSIFIKDDGAGYGGFTLLDGTNHHIAVLADLTAGTIVDTDVGITTGTITASGCDDVGNGWFRVWAAGDFFADGSCFIVPFACNVAAPTWTSTGRPVWDPVEGEDIFLWGGDVQAGSFLTSYIPTTTASVTRNRDSITATGIAASIVNPAAGTLYADSTRTGTDGDDTIFTLWETTVIGFNLYHDDAARNAFVVANTGTQCNVRNNLINNPAGTRIRAAVAYAENDFMGYEDGLAYTPDTLGTVPSVDITKISVGENAYAQGMDAAHIARIVYYDERLTDAQLEDLSNGTFPAEEADTLVGTFTEDQWFHRRRYLRRVRDNRRLYLRRRG